MAKKQINILPVYQSANSNDYYSVKNNFIVHRVEYEIIIDSLLNKSNNDSVQHELILGKRGSGKSMLLKRVEAEIVENKKLKNKYIPVNPAEEQAGIYRLMDLWEQVLLELSCKLGIEIRLKDFSEFVEEQDYSRYLYSEIHKICVQEKKKAVLLLDNFDRIVGNFTDDGNLLRETLINFNDLVIIAASTRMDEHFWQYDQPFYEFFRKHHLQTLSSAETFQLLEHWSKVLNRPKIKNFIEKYPGKVENIRLLTDGLPRTMQFFMEIVLQNEKSVDIDFLQKIMDEATPQYRERLISETPPMRKILLEMAFIWEACSTKQLAEKCKMTSKLVSANLKTLTSRNLVELITTDKRYHLYRISERFFNMWLILTQGNPEQKRKARWMSIFLENFCSSQASYQLAKQYISQENNELAEKYYLLEIEKGDNNALWILSGMYYSQNRKKDETKQYLNKYKGNNIFLIIIEIWLGIFNDVENRITAIFKENTDNRYDLIERLLIHHQKTLVNKLFEHAEFGNKLQEHYKPLYYACRILNGKANENNLILRIPPELDSTVKAILNRIEELQKFYE
ncbi:MAG: AAA family ATPase [Prevotellaceae bacterium]|jgi:DNA-binding MarR family transcriptional regulator|nr:AAA family ATPase [Prevotellaceae bacterium]